MMTKNVSKAYRRTLLFLKATCLCILSLPCIFQNSNAQVTIGSGNNAGTYQFSPFVIYYGYARDASIYTTSEMNTLSAGATITTLAWNSQGFGNTAPIKIYLKTVGTATEVVSDTWSNTISNATLVYDGTPLNTISGWNTFDITDYTIAANENLEVLVETNYGGYGLSGPGTPTFYYSNTSGINSHGSITVDANPPVTETLILNAARPDIRLGGLTPLTCPAPSGLFAQDIIGTSATVGVPLVTPTPMNYQYYLSEISTPPTSATNATGTVIASDSSATLITLANLTPSTTYYLWVRANCSTTDVSNWSYYVSFTSAPPPPANDECANALPITVNPDPNCIFSESGSTVSATQSADATGAALNPAGIDDDVWYEFTATSDHHRIELNTDQTNGATIALYNGSCGTLTYIDAVSTPSYYAEMDATNLTPGAVYKIRVYSSTDITGSNVGFTLCVKTIPPPPANDECAAAIALPVNATQGCTSVTAGTTLSATQSNLPTQDQLEDVWYTFTATSTTHRITLSDFSEYMTIMFYGGDCSALTLLAQNESYYGMTSLTTDLSNLTVGNTYRIKVAASYTDHSSDFNICVGPPPPPPSNDECTNAAQLTVDPTGNCFSTESGTTLSATHSNEIISPDQNGTGTDDDVWYKFTATDTALRITLSEITGTTVDMEMAVYSGSCGSLTYLQSSFFPTMDVHDLIIGQEYKVRVYTYNASGSATFKICLRPLPPANDEAAGAVALTVGAGCTGSLYDNSLATQSADEPYPSCASQNTGAMGFKTMWFKFVAPASGMVKISCDGNGTMDDSRMALYEVDDADDYSTFNILACDDNNGVITENRSIFYAAGLTPNVTYYINIDHVIRFDLYTGPTGAAGTYCLTVDAMDAAMLNTTAGDCIGGQSVNLVNTDYHGWISLVDNSGDLIANVRQLSGSATSFTSSTTVKTGAPRTDANSTPYLNRNFLINGADATSTDVQLFFTDNELANIATPIQDLNVTKVSGNICNADYASGDEVSVLTQTANGHPASGVNYIQFNTPSFSNFYIMPGSVPLPLKLISFNGQNKNTINELNWTTTDEKGLDRFDIQRSDDGTKFATIGTVKARNSQGEGRYVFNDEHPINGKNFYRLNMIDESGKSSVSEIVQLNANVSNRVSLFLAPNPVKQLLKITVSGEADQSAMVQVIDLVGKVVKTVKMDTVSVQVDMSKLPSGTYIIKYTDNTNSSVYKIIKH